MKEVRIDYQEFKQMEDELSRLKDLLLKASEGDGNFAFEYKRNHELGFDLVAITSGSEVMEASVENTNKLLKLYDDEKKKANDLYFNLMIKEKELKDLKDELKDELKVIIKETGGEKTSRIHNLLNKLWS